MTTLNFTFEQEHYLTQTAKNLGMSLESFILAKVNYKATPNVTSVTSLETQSTSNPASNPLANRLVLMDDLIAPVDDNVWEVD